MESALNEWLLYKPPKSTAFGHTSKPRDPRKAWPMTEAFLHDLTDFTRDEKIELSCYGPDSDRDVAVSMARIKEARKIFGLEINPSETCPRWKINPAQFEVAIRFAMDDDKFPQQGLGPTHLYFHYRFHWKEFERVPYQSNGNEFQRQESSLGVYLGARRLFLQTTFLFPAPWHSSFLRDFITRVETATPFRFRDQYFMRLLPSKSGRGGRGFKLSKGWRTAAM